MTHPRPSTLVSTAVIAAVGLVWGWLRLIVFRESVFPLTFVLPLLLGVWTGRRWQIWSMAAMFLAMAVVKSFWLLPAEPFGKPDRWLLFGTTVVNVVIGAAVVQAILTMRENLEVRNATIAAQNAELEAQTEELFQQNEEIRSQAEELAEQNEEIETQSEEVARQNEDLLDLNSRLTGRETILETVLHATRSGQPLTEILQDLCERTVATLGHPAAEVAILEEDGPALKVVARSQTHGPPLIPALWPLAGSLAGVVLGENRTAYLSDLRQRRDLARPFATESGVGSVLATPLSSSTGGRGLLVACSTGPGHWTGEHFKVVEWIAAQCAVTAEALRSQKALAEHATALQQASQAKDRFLAMLSHELRTPLTPVLALASAREDDASLSPDVREDFRVVRRNVAIQSRLIDDLLDLTRIGRGKVDLERRPVSPAPLLRDAVGIVSGDLQLRSQSIVLDIDRVGNRQLIGDGARLQQVFWNLLKNAGKFSVDGSTIFLTAAAEDDLLKVEVRDQGDGIDPEDIDRIFLPFEQRLAGESRPSDSGLGLGLAIAKAVLDLHGGQISAHSGGRGRGSTFRVTLPLLPPTQPAPAVDSPTPPLQADGHRSGRILLVEDHVDTGQTLARLLRLAGYHVEHADTAAGAFTLFSQNGGFDVVVSDLGLPDESGISLMRRLRQHDPAVKALCMSGYGMEGDIAASREAGFHDHLTKPIDLQRLKSAIAGMMDGVISS